MDIRLPADLQTLVHEQLATGTYREPEDVIRAALTEFARNHQTLSDIQESLADIEAGDVRDMASVVAEIRQRHGWTPSDGI